MKFVPEAVVQGVICWPGRLNIGYLYIVLYILYILMHIIQTVCNRKIDR